MPFQKPYQYVIDSSALFDLKNQYPSHIFSSVWERFNEMVLENKIVSTREVLREISKGNDELIEWAKENVDFFLEPSNEELFIMQDIMQTKYTQREIDKYSTRPWADPFVISCAKHFRLPLIQHEKNDPFKIPTICKTLDVECLTLIEFFEEENWTF